MRTKIRIQAFLSSTTAGENDLAQAEWGYETCDAMDEGSSRRYRLAPGAVDTVLDLAGLADVRFLMVRSDKEITLKLTTTGPVDNTVKISVPSGFNFGYALLCTQGVIGLKASNAGTDTATMTLLLAGDVA